MIKQIFSIADEDLKLLGSNCYTRKVRANFLAYGCDYDFARFYELIVDGCYAVISIFNSSMVVAIKEASEIIDEFYDDIVSLIKMTMPFSVEIDNSAAKVLKEKLKDDYIAVKRTDFIFNEGEYISSENIICNPRLDNVYDVLKSCFPNIRSSYDLWLTDNSHRIRRGISNVFLFGNHTTATVHYVLDNIAFVGLVGTSEDQRGKGYARNLLYYIHDYYAKKGIEVHLFARDNRVQFYKEIGFKDSDHNLIFERKQ